MRTKILVLTLAALSLAAPPARAGHAQVDCDSTALVRVGGNAVTTAIVGYVASPTAGEPVSIRCYFTVNGSEYPGAGTSTGVGTQVAVVTAAPVTFVVSDSDVVHLCGDWTAGSEAGTSCFDTTTTRFPPDELADLLQLIRRLPDPILCPALMSLAPGIPGIVDIDPDGDLFALGTIYHDCPPYGF